MMLNFLSSSQDIPASMVSYFIYALVLLVYGWRLRHLFNKRVQWLGWLLLAGQILILTMHNWPIGPESWWHHDFEGNLPVIFATFQLVSGSFFALAISRLAPRASRWLRVYWALLALGLYVMAVDDFGYLHDRFPPLVWLYPIGAVLMLALLVVVFRELEKRQRVFLFMLLVGLGISAIGALYVDKTPNICGNFAAGVPLKCFRTHPLEESLEKLGAFFVVMAAAGAATVSIPPERWRRARRALLPAFALPTIGLLSLLALVNLQQGIWNWNTNSEFRGLTFYHPTDFANGYHLNASYFPSKPEIYRGSFDFVTLFGLVHDEIEKDFGYSLHVIDQESVEIYAVHEHWSRLSAAEWRASGYLADQQKYWVPEEVPTGRALWLVFSLWQETEPGEFAAIPITASEGRQLSDTQLVIREFVIAAPAAPLPEKALDYRFENGSALRGAEMPATARAGETLVIPMTWEMAAESANGGGTEGGEDWTQFLHFVNEETGALWNHDQPPLGARLPTRLWYAGLRDVESWQVALPADLPPGRYAVYTGLYRHSDLARLPVRAGGEDEGWLPDARAPLGWLEISAP